MNQLDPLTNLPEKPKDDFDFSNLIKDSNQIPSFVAAGDYGKYNAGISPYLSDTERKTALSNNQGFWAGAGNSALRVLGNIIPSTIQGFGYLEDVVTGTPDGNAVTESMQEWIDSVNNNLPLYSDPSNKIFNWENISGLATSVASFAATGAGVGSILGQLGRLGKIGQGVAQLGTATALTGIEGALEANQLLKSEYTNAFNKLYVDEINSGKTQDEARIVAESKAKEYVANAAHKSYLTNYLNVALNLTSAGYFIKGGALNKIGRVIDPINRKNTLMKMGYESIQEAAEEGVNVWATTTGKTKLKTNLEGKGDNYTYQDIWDNVDRDELMASMVLGAIGGMGQTAISIGVGNINTKWYKGKYAQLKEKYAEQKDFIDRVSQQYNDPKDISNVMLDITQTAAKIKQAEDFRKAGNIESAEQVEKDILASQTYNALKTDTINDFKDLFTSFVNNDQTALTPEQKTQATKALQYINQYQNIYRKNNNLVPAGNPAGFQLFNNRVTDFHLREALKKEEDRLQEIQNAKSEIVNGLNEVKSVKDRATLQEALKSRTQDESMIGNNLVDIRKQIINNDNKYADLLKLNEKDLNVQGKLTKALFNQFQKAKDKTFNAKNEEELAKALGTFKSKEEQTAALRDAANRQNTNTSIPDFTSLETTNDFLSKRYENKAALQKVDFNNLSNIVGQTIESTEQLADIIFNGNNEAVKEYFNVKTQEALKAVDEELTEMEQLGVEVVSAINTPDAIDLIRNIDTSITSSDSEIPISHPKESDKFDPRFEEGQNMMNDVNSKLPGKTIFFEVENRKDEPNQFIGINNGKIVSGKEDSFEVLVVYYKDGNSNNKSKNNRIRLGKLRANSWTTKRGELVNLDPAFLRIREEILKSLDFTKGDIYTLPQSTTIKKIIPGKIHTRDKNVQLASPKSLLKDGEKLILGVVVNKGGNNTFEYGGEDITGVAYNNIRFQDIQRIKPGSVYMLVKSPDGSYYPIKLFVKKINDLTENKKKEYIDKIDSLINRFFSEGNTKENRQSLYKQLKSIAYVNFVFVDASQHFRLRDKEGNLGETLTAQQLKDLFLQKLIQVDSEKINRGSYNETLNNDGVIVSNLAQNRFTGANIVMTPPSWGVVQPAPAPTITTTIQPTVTFNGEEEEEGGIDASELRELLGEDVMDLMEAGKEEKPLTLQEERDALIDSWGTTLPQDDFSQEEIVYEDEITPATNVESKFPIGTTIKWDVFGNEKMGDWTIAEHTTTRGGKPAIRLTRFIEQGVAKGGGKAGYTQEQIVSVEDLLGKPTESKPKEEVSDIERRIQEVENFVNQDFFANSELLSNHWKTKKDLFENKIKQLRSLLQKGIKTGEDLRTLTNLLNDVRGILNEGININDKTPILTNEKNIQELADSLFSLISDDVIKDYIQVMNKAMESRVGPNAVEKMLVGYSDGSGYTIDGKNIEYFLSKETLENAKNNKQINAKYDAGLEALEKSNIPTTPIDSNPSKQPNQDSLSQTVIKIKNPLNESNINVLQFFAKLFYGKNKINQTVGFKKLENEVLDKMSKQTKQYFLDLWDHISKDIFEKSIIEKSKTDNDKINQLQYALAFDLNGKRENNFLWDSKGFKLTTIIKPSEVVLKNLEEIYDVNATGYIIQLNNDRNLQQPTQDSSNDDLLDMLGDMDNNIPPKKYKLNKQVSRLWNKEKELRRLKSILPESIAINVFNDLLEIGDEVAYGYYQQAVIHIFENAEEGTAYHEAVHAVFELLLTDKEKQSLLKEAEEKFYKNGISNEEYAYFNKRYPNLTKEQLKEIILEEAIAEEFKTYAINNKPQGVIGRLFTRLKNWWNNIFKKGLSLDNFYKNLNSGLYKKNKIKMNTSFANPMFSLRKMDAFKRHKRLSALKGIYSELMDELHLLDGNNSKSDVEIIKSLGKDGVNVILSMIVTKVTNELIASQKSNTLSDSDKKYLKEEYLTLLKNFITNSNFTERIDSPVILQYLNNQPKLVKVTVDIDSPLLMDFLMSLENYGISVKIQRADISLDINKSREDEEIVTEEGERLFDEDEDVDSNSNELWQVKVNQIRSDDSFSEDLKRILSSIKKLETDDLGFNQLEDYPEVRNWLFENISNIYDVDLMMSILKDNAPVKGFVNAIYNRAVYDVKFRTDLFVYIASKSDDNYVSIILDKDGSVRTIRSNRTNVRNVIIEDLKNQFSKSPILNKDGSINVKVANEFKNAIYDYNSLLNDRRRTDEFFDKVEIGNLDVYYYIPKDFIVKDLANIFKKYSIDINYDQLRAIGNKGFTSYDALVGDKGMKSVANYLANSKNIFSLSDEKLSEGSLLEYIAKLLIPVTLHKAEKSMNTVDNKTIFTHSYNNFAKELVAKLRNRETSNLLIDNYISSHFYEDSFFFNMLKNDEYNRNELTIDILDGINEESGKRFDDLNRGDLEWMNIHAFYNQNRKFAYYRLPALSDSPQTAFLKFSKFDIDESFWDKVYSVVLQEHKRNEYLKSNPELIDSIDNVKKRMKNPFILFPFMNNMKDVDIINNKDLVINKAKEYFNNEFEKELKRLNSLHLINIDGLGRITSSRFDTRMSSQDPSTLRDNLNTYFYNTLLMNTQLISVFSGDPIFYKSNNDWQKRNKQIWSPTLMLDVSQMRNESADENYHTINIKDYEPGSDSNFINYIKDLFKNDPNLNQIVKKFTENNATDAQSFITIKRYKSIMKGLNRWTDNHEEIYEKAINKELTLNEIDEFYNDYWSTFSPLKPFDFQHLSSIEIDGKTYTFKLPYQVKRAELPVLPQLIDDPILKKIMEKAEQFENEKNTTVAINFESAVKVGAHNKYNNAEEFINDKNPKFVALSNRRYGFQVEVPEHFIETDNNFGSQIMKLIMADIPLNTIFTEKQIPNLKSLFTQEEINNGITFEKLIDKYQNLIGVNIKQNFNKLKRDINNRRDLKRLLWRNGLQNNLPSHYFQAVGDPKTNDDFELPLWFPGWGKKNEQILHSLLRNRVVKQKFPGASLVNVSSFGNQRSDDLKVVYDKDTGALLHYEARLPWWVSSYFKPFLTNDGTGNIDIDKMKMVLGEEEADKLLNIVAYRIPTEHKHSMFNIKIVGFTTSVNGGIIQLPHEATTISGFDFDVDKLYAMFPSIDFIKDENGEVTSIKKTEYNADTLLSTNNSKERFNAILDIIQGILSHPLSAPQTLKPSTFDHLKDIAYRIYLASKGHKDVLKRDIDTGEYVTSFDSLKKSIEEESLDLALPSTQSEYIIRNSVGKALIGFFANHNTAHAYSQHTSLEVATSNDEYPGFKYRNYYKDENGKLQYDDVLITATLLNQLENINGTLISKELASFLAAATDNAKDPIASFMNLNTFTVDTYAYLIRLGFDPETIALFMGQEAVEKITADYYSSSSSNAKDMAFNKYKNEFIDNVYKKLIDTTGIHLKKSIHNFTDEILRKRLSQKYDVEQDYLKLNEIKQRANKALAEQRINDYNQINIEHEKKRIEHINQYRDYYVDQYYIARTFEKYNKAATDLGTLSTAVKVDNTSNRSSISDSLVIKEKFEDIGSLKNLKNTADFYELPILQAFYDNGLNDGIRAFSKIFPWMENSFTQIKKDLASIKGKRLTAQEMDSINYHFLTFLATGFDFFSSEKYNDTVKNLPKNIDEYIDKNPNSSYIAFLRRFVIRERKAYDRATFKTFEFYRQGLNNLDKQQLTDMWESMLNSNNPTERKIAEDLVYYSFVVSGFSVGPFSFTDYIPSSFYIGLKDSQGIYFKDYMKAQLAAMNTKVYDVKDQFIQQYLQNNYSRSSAKYKILRKAIDKQNINGVISQGNDPGFLLINDENLKKSFSNSKIEGDEITYTPVKYIGYKSNNRDYLFQYEGLNPEGMHLYKRMKTLGYKNYFTEYDLYDNNPVLINGLTLLDPINNLKTPVIDQELTKDVVITDVNEDPIDNEVSSDMDELDSLTFDESGIDASEISDLINTDEEKTEESPIPWFEDTEDSNKEIVKYYEDNWENLTEEQKKDLLIELGISTISDLGKLNFNDHVSFGKLLTIKCKKVIK